MKKIQTLILMLACMAVSGFARAANVYVTQSGGTVTPLDGRDWQHAVAGLPASLSRGNVYYLASGNYGSYDFDDAENGTTWIKILKATQGNSGSVAGWNASYDSGQASFGTLSFWRDYYEINGQRRNNTQWEDSASYGFKVFHLVSSTDNLPPGADFITVKYCSIGGSVMSSSDNVAYQDDGFRIDGGNGAGEIHDYVFSQNYSSKVGPTHLYLNHVHDFTIEENYFHENYGKEAIQGIYQAYNIVIRNNKFVDTCQEAVSAGEHTYGATAEVAGWAHSQGNWDNWEIYGNIFTKKNFKGSAHTDALIMGGSPPEGITVNNWKVYNNVIAGMVAGGNGGLQTRIWMSGTNNRVYNNLWYDMGAGLNVSCDATECSNNWCGGGTCGNIGVNSTAGNGNPFVDYANLNFRLNGTTNARDTGKVLGAGYDSLDPDSHTRGGNGSGWDVGAYEYCPTCPVVTPTPTPGSTPTPTPGATPTPAGQEANGTGFLSFKNIFNPSKGESLTFKFGGSSASLTIYDRQGGEVRRLNGTGGQSIWDGRNDQGEIVVAGTYLVMLHGPNGEDETKVVVVK